MVSKASFFDSIVRSPTTPPPWKDYNRTLFAFRDHRVSALFFVSILWILIGHALLFPHLKWTGFWIYNAVHLLFQYSDAMTSNSFGNNIKRCRQAGFQDGVVLAIMESNMIASQLIGYVIMTVLCEGYEPYFNGTLVWRVILSMTVAELGFTMGHWLLHLHPTLASWHILHHCCKESTFSTNVMFHPVDLAAEFAGPAAGLLGLHFLIFNEDKFALLITYLVFQCWYAADHDERLRLPHTMHHQHCDAMYTIYTSRFRGSPQKNVLKAKMSKILE